MGIAAATVATALVSAGSSYYSYKKQEEAQAKAEREAELARIAEEERQLAIFEATKPEEEEAKIDFGIDTNDDYDGFSEFLVKRPTQQQTIASLGFGTLGV